MSTQADIDALTKRAADAEDHLRREVASNQALVEQVKTLRHIACAACLALAEIADDPSGMEAQALMTEWTGTPGSAGEEAAKRVVAEIKSLRAALAAVAEST